MDTLQALKARKSVRSYLPKPIEKDTLDVIIEAGKHAPNAGAFQITAITNPALLKEINDATLQAMKDSGIEFLMQRAAIPGYEPLYGASALVMLSSAPAPYAQANTSCAATCMTLAATDLGLGSCYVVTPALVLGGTNELSQKAGIKEGNASVCGVLLGYEQEGSIPPAQRASLEVNYVE